jgi:hypothetical protein
LQQIDLDEWDGLLGMMPGAHPYHTAAWGRIVASIFGGRFRVFSILGDASQKFVPIFEGGEFGGEGFVSGHIGYGGALDSIVGTSLQPIDHIHAIHLVESHLGRRCNRLVTSPDKSTIWPEFAVEYPLEFRCRATLLLSLSEGEEKVWARHAGSVRTAVRRCLASGLESRLLKLTNLKEATELIRQTQARVGAVYQVRSELVEALVNAYPFCIGMSCWREGRLLSVGFFLRFAGRAAYLFNGWSYEDRDLAPNYMMLHAAIRELSRFGDKSLDLGFSHKPDLYRSKLRWGAREAQYLVGIRRETK